MTRRSRATQVLRESPAEESGLSISCHAEAASDEELMAAVARGDLEGLATLFDRHHRRLFGFLLAMGSSPNEAEDAVQETFARVLRYRRSYRYPRRVLPWLLSIARNASYSAAGPARADEASSMQQQEPPDPRSLGPGIEWARIDFERLRQEIAALPVLQREAVLLTQLYGLRSAEVATLVGASDGAVRVRVHRAMRSLRERFAEPQGEEL